MPMQPNVFVITELPNAASSRPQVRQQDKMPPEPSGSGGTLSQIDGRIHAVDIALIQLPTQQIDGLAETVNMKHHRKCHQQPLFYCNIRDY